MSVDEITRKHLPADPAPTLEWIGEAEAWLRAHVFYQHDHQNRRIGRPVDHWRTLLPEILRRLEREDFRPVADDCDAWSFTALDIAIWAGVQQDSCRLALCLSPWGQVVNQHPVDHMIALVDIGGWHVVGDTFRIGPYPLAECPHRIHKTHRLPISNYDWQTGGL